MTVSREHDRSEREFFEAMFKKVCGQTPQDFLRIKLHDSEWGTSRMEAVERLWDINTVGILKEAPYTTIFTMKSYLQGDDLKEYDAMWERRKKRLQGVF